MNFASNNLIPLLPSKLFKFKTLIVEVLEEEVEEDHFVVEDKEEEMCQVKIQAHSKEEEEELVEVTMEEEEDEKESSSTFLDDDAFDPIEEEGSTPPTPPSNSPPNSSSSSSSSESPPRKTRSMADLYGATRRILEDEFVDFALYANADPYRISALLLLSRQTLCLQRICSLAKMSKKNSIDMSDFEFEIDDLEYLIKNRVNSKKENDEVLLPNLPPEITDQVLLPYLPPEVIYRILVKVPPEKLYEEFRLVAHIKNVHWPSDLILAQILLKWCTCMLMVLVLRFLQLGDSSNAWKRIPGPWNNSFERPLGFSKWSDPVSINGRFLYWNVLSPKFVLSVDVNAEAHASYSHGETATVMPAKDHKKEKKGKGKGKA
ncbi:hypothetical protein POM88_039537 [Heracleum sosnowskyi]|uniref:F-box domain-containing protein n=1 Tax=Heracleum sosnowskyi TaxID=360622 RepID=A0AAD8M7X4_9APIA|nr:hypothetical protein POM88_039537 [Heracleum sosnowskyi]